LNIIAFLDFPSNFTLGHSLDPYPYLYSFYDFVSSHSTYKVRVCPIYGHQLS